MSLIEFLGLAAHFALLSLLTVGGYTTVLPEVHRQLVLQRGWLDEAAFSQTVALGQAAPGPNIIVISLLGYAAAGWMGLLACLGGILLPSLLLILRFGRWARAHPEHRGLRSFQQGAAPLVLGLSLASAGLLAQPLLQGLAGLLLFAAVALGSALRPKTLPLLWLAAGAAAGYLGLV